MHGRDALDRAREKDPVGYIRVIVSLVPRQREEVLNPFDDFTDEELEKLAAYLEGIRDEAAEKAAH